jgi:hypothetical protein
MVHKHIPFPIFHHQLNHDQKSFHSNGEKKLELISDYICEQENLRKKQ